MPYDTIDELPKSVRYNLPKHDRKFLKKHLTMHGKSIKKLKIDKEMLQEKKHPLKLHGLLLKKVIIKINQETG